MENIKLIVCNDRTEIDKISADIIADVIKSNKKSVLGLNTGKSPLGIYNNLIQKYVDGEISFKFTTTFNLDEYLELKDEDKNNSREFFMNANFFSKINIKNKNTYFPIYMKKQNINNLIKFEKKIHKKGPINIQLLGLGKNGHIGFNEPGSKIDSRTRIVDLTKSTIESNSIYFQSKDNMPTSAASMGIGTILQADKILLVAFGKEKSSAIKNFFYFKKFDESLPASSLWNHKDVYIVVDKDAVSKLSQKDIENYSIGRKK